jgi:anti-sigma B factor antagonist
MDLTVNVRQDGARTIVEVEGELDLHTAPTLKSKLTELIDSGHIDLVVDLDGLEFFDSTGLGVLVAAHRKVQELNGSFRLACTQPRVLRVLSITKTTELFSIYASQADALSHS